MNRNDPTPALVGVTEPSEETEARRELVLAKEAAEAAGARIVRILESITDAFMVIGRDWRFDYLNHQAERLLDRSRTELIGRVIWEELPELVGSDFERHFRAAVENDQSASFEAYYAPLAAWFEVRAYPSSEGLSIYFRDVTGRARAEEALRRSEERFRLLVQNSADILTMFDAEGTILYESPSVERVLGIKPEERVGHNIFRDPITHPDDRAAKRTFFETALSHPGVTVTGQFRLRHKDGSYRDIEAVATNQLDAPAVCGIVANYRDITERKQFEEALRLALDEAEAAGRAKDQFLAVLSHELRNPLNPVLVGVSALLTDPDTPDSVRPTLEVTRRNVALEARLIDDLLDVTRIRQGKLTLQREVVDASVLVREAIEICRKEIAAASLRLTLDLSSPCHHVEADPARIQQVLWNLIKNAAKFTPAGGSIEVRSRLADDNTLIVEVSDTGVGITPEALPRIFNAFEQGDSWITRQFGGLGLGLAISRSLAEAHGGRLSAASAGSGQGSTFTLALPTVPAPAARLRGHRPSQGVAALPLLRILLVEDNPDSRRILSRLLRSRGHRVTTAASVACARSATASEGPFDLVISDLGLPDGSGLDVMRHVLSCGPAKGIALSGYGREDDIRQTRDAGFSAHLTKPVDFTRLEDEIRRVASRD